MTRGKIRWGIAATGGIAARFARSMSLVEGSEIVAVASRTEQRASQFAEQFGIAHAYGSYEALAQDTEIDVVYVATPHSATLPTALPTSRRESTFFVKNPSRSMFHRRATYSRLPGAPASSSWKPCGHVFSRPTISYGSYSAKGASVSHSWLRLIWAPGLRSTRATGSSISRKVEDPFSISAFTPSN